MSYIDAFAELNEVFEHLFQLSFDHSSAFCKLSDIVTISQGS